MSRNLLALVDAGSPFFDYFLFAPSMHKIAEPCSWDGTLRDVLAFSSNEPVATAITADSNCVSGDFDLRLSQELRVLDFTE